MYMYTEKQIENLNKWGFVVKPKLVSELNQFDKVYYQTRVVEPNSHSSVTHYVQFYSWTLTELCHCHLDWKYYERRQKHVRTLIHKDGYEFEDHSIYFAQDRLIHSRHTMDSRRYAKNDIDKRPTKEHLVMNCYDEELEPCVLVVYKDDVVFVLEDMSNIERNVDVHFVGMPNEDNYFEPYIVEGLRSPVTFYNYVFNNPFNKKCIDCLNNDIPYTQQHKGYFGDYDIRENINRAYEDITMHIVLVDEKLKDKTFTEEMTKLNDIDRDFISALRVLEDAVPSNFKSTIWGQNNLWKRFLSALDIYNGLKQRYEEVNSKVWSHEDYLYVVFGSNVKRKSRKVLEY